jgi:hypothetical protein
MQSKEARLILGAAIVDYILAIAALSVVTTMGRDIIIFFNKYTG